MVFKIQNEIKIPARGKQCNQNKAVSTLLAGVHAPGAALQGGSRYLDQAQAAARFLPSSSEGVHGASNTTHSMLNSGLICQPAAVTGTWNLSVASKLTKSRAGKVQVSLLSVKLLKEIVLPSSALVRSEGRLCSPGTVVLGGYAKHDCASHPLPWALRKLFYSLSADEPRNY